MARNEVGTNVLDDYQRDGFVSGIPILTPHETAIHRQHLERAESVFGSSLHYVNKVHTALKSPLEVATHPMLLDVVSSLIGPNVLVYNVTFIIKEAMTPTFVSWHQDLTYWGSKAVIKSQRGLRFPLLMSKAGYGNDSGQPPMG